MQTVPHRRPIQTHSFQGMPPGEFAHEHKQFHKSYVHLGSIARMMAAGWLIDKLQLKDPVQKAAVWAGVGMGLGYVESLMKERQARKDARPER